jgi:hypothetical protein
MVRKRDRDEKDGSQRPARRDPQATVRRCLDRYVCGCGVL